MDHLARGEAGWALERDLMLLRLSRLRRTQSGALRHLLHEGVEKGQAANTVPSPRLRGEGPRRGDEVPYFPPNHASKAANARDV